MSAFSSRIFWHHNTSLKSLPVLWHIGRCQKEVLILCFSIDKDLASRCGDIQESQERLSRSFIQYCLSQGKVKQVEEINMMAKIEKNLWKKYIYTI